jgi:cyclase
LDVIEWAKKAEELGAGEILLTSMDEDGRLNGYDIELTKAVSRAVSLPVIASGGAGKDEHLLSVLTEGGASAVLAASIFHDGTYNIRQIKEYLHRHQIAVRL